MLAPVAQDVWPKRHSEGLVPQLWPLTHATHWALALHTRPAPHAVPTGFAPVSTQVGAPELHAIRPSMHGAPGFVAQPRPAWQNMHPPLPVQTKFMPQLVPAAEGTPSSQPVSAPQVVTPTKHGWPGFVAHAAPDTQAAQPPSRHTWSGPQAVPSGFAAPFAQRTEPPAHSVMPTWHARSGGFAQASPPPQLPHSPVPSQVPPGHERPASAGSKESTQPTGSQVLTPSRHGEALPVQRAPETQPPSGVPESATSLTHARSTQRSPARQSPAESQAKRTFSGTLTH